MQGHVAHVPSCSPAFSDVTQVYDVEEQPRPQVSNNERLFKCTRCKKCVDAHLPCKTNVTSALNKHKVYTITSEYTVVKGPTSVLGVKNASDNHLTYKTICGYTVEKDPTNVLIATSVSDGHHI